MLKRYLFSALAAAGLFVMTGCGRQPSWKMNVMEETICLEGIEEEYNLLFITDTHVTVRDEKADERLRSYTDERYSMFVNEEGIDAQTQFEAYISYADEQEVDGVLLGGDIIDCPSEENLQWLAGQLGRLRTPCLYVPGNHDWTYPWEYMTEDGIQNLLPLLEPVMQGNTELNTLDIGELRVIGINDSANQVSAAVFPEYERLCADQKPTLVLAHVPFMTQSALGRAREVWSSPVVIGAGNYGGIYPDENSERFVELLTAADSPVELVLAGHVHFYDKDFIEGEKNVLQLIGGAGYEGNVLLLHIRGKK